MRRVTCILGLAALSLPSIAHAAGYACLNESLAPVGCGTAKATVCYAPGNPAACIDRGYPHRGGNMDIYCVEPSCTTAPTPQSARSATQPSQSPKRPQRP